MEAWLFLLVLGLCSGKPRWGWELGLSFEAEALEAPKPVLLLPWEHRMAGFSSPKWFYQFLSDVDFTGFVSKAFQCVLSN